MKNRITVLCLFLFCNLILTAQSGGEKSEDLIRKGWSAFVQDNDTTAIRYFEIALEQSTKQNEIENKASALLHLGICYYGVSPTKGLEYCFSSMAEYKKLETTDAKKALEGRSRCLQLISTIYNRQGKFAEAITLSREALAGFTEGDTSGYRGLIFTSIATAYEKTAPDSSDYYNRLALAEQLRSKNFVYQPSAYINVADIELRNGNKPLSEKFYRRALQIADSTENHQAEVLSLLGIGRWQKKSGDADSAMLFFTQAKRTASELRDKMFYLKALEELSALEKEKADFKQAMMYEEEMNTVRDSMYSYDRQKLAKNLEVQFNVAEKDRKLTILQKENDIARLSNYLLGAIIGFIFLLSVSIIVFLRNTNKKNRELLLAQESLVKEREAQNKIREQYLQNEIEFKETQLSAMALQMMQKNNLMQEIKEKIGEGEKELQNLELKKIINKELNHEKEWADFNSSFESINRNFYAKIREAYPDISPNDLKICALIKLNLSSKEMAGILNISPDSVKTARYRLRKKLSLNTEDNLSEFILKLS